MNEIFDREIKRLARLRKLPSVFKPRTLTTTERYFIRAQAFNLLPTTDREQVIDMLLTEHKFLAWHQAEQLVRQAESALERLKAEA